MLDPTSGHFYRLHFAVPSTAPLIRQLATSAETTEDAKRNARRVLYGSNTIVVPFRVMGILVEQVLHPFYIFQTLSIILWALWDYWSYLSLIVLLSLGCLAIEFYEVRFCAVPTTTRSHSCFPAVRELGAIAAHGRFQELGALQANGRE